MTWREAEGEERGNTATEDAARRSSRGVREEEGEGGGGRGRGRGRGRRGRGRERGYSGISLQYTVHIC